MNPGPSAANARTAPLWPISSRRRRRGELLLYARSGYELGQCRSVTLHPLPRHPAVSSGELGVTGHGGVVKDTDLPTDSSHSLPLPDEQHSRVGQEARRAHQGSGQDQPPRGRAAAPWRAWLGWFAAFLLIGAGWALVAPLDQVPDEADHVYRAAAVVRGQVFPDNVTYDHGTGAIENVPVGLMRPAVIPGPCGRSPNAWRLLVHLGAAGRGHGGQRRGPDVPVLLRAGGLALAGDPRTVPAGT